MSGFDRLLRVLTSLDSPQDQTLSETAVDAAAGFVPVLGTLQALRDFERARREDDKLGMALSGLGAIPVVGGAAKVGRKIFGGPRGATKAEKAALEQAQALRKQDPNAETWTETGWMETPDKSWMNEIDDSRASLKAVSNQLYIDHPELLKRYPQFESYRIKLANLPGHVKAEYDPSGVIRINKSLPESRRFNVALHELQHAVDFAEGRQYGANSGVGGAMDRLASQLLYGQLAQDTIREADKALRLMKKHNLSPQEAADFVADNLGPSIDVSMLNRLLNNPDMINEERMIADSLVSLLRKANVQDTAYMNYLREPGEVRARTTQYRQNLSPDQRRQRNPAYDMKYFIDNPVEMAQQLRLYSPLKF